MAAAIVVAVLGLDAQTFFGVPPRAHAAEAVGATLARDGAETALRPGAELQVGDRITTDSTGRATLVVAGGEVRLASAAVDRAWMRWQRRRSNSSSSPAGAGTGSAARPTGTASSRRP